jgi:hypothetical protein
MLTTLLVLTACGRHENTTTTTSARTSSGPILQSTTTLTPEQLGELGAEIAKQPENGQQLLTAKGLDQQTFEAQIRKVSEDPAAARRYAAAFKAASK